MAVIHRTTLTPSKLELLASWLPAQPWYRPEGPEPELARAGGFRLDDPDGAVGIEFFVAADRAATYLVPLTYRADPCPQAAGGLIGTAEHGVLGHRWIYDGAHDPVLITALVGLLQGDAQAQAQSESNTPDLTVTSQPITSGHLAVLASRSRRPGRTAPTCVSRPPPTAAGVPTSSCACTGYSGPATAPRRDGRTSWRPGGAAMAQTSAASSPAFPSAPVAHETITALPGWVLLVIPTGRAGSRRRAAGR